MAVKQNTRRVKELREAVEGHPLCYRLKVKRDNATAYFPLRAFPEQELHGVRVSWARGGKAKAFSTLLTKLEALWTEGCE